MKKLFAILLCIVMMLSMVACGGNQGNTENPNNNQGNAGVSNEQPKGEPTEEEQRAIGNYVAALDALDKFAETGSWANLSFDCQQFGVEYEGDNYIIEGAAAAEKYYELISNLGAMDKWVGTEYAVGETVNWDRQAVLDSFVIYKDMKLSENYTVYDPVGNTKNLSMNWYYDNDGKLEQVRWDSEIGERYPYSFVFNPIEVDPLRLMMEEYDHRAEPVFDADGKVTEVKIIGGGETMFLAKLTYGSNGKVSTASVTSAYGDNGTLTYSYDNQDRLTEVSFQGDNGLMGYVYYLNSYWDGRGEYCMAATKNFTYTYTYNTDGTVAKKEYTAYEDGKKNHVVVTQYSYDTNGWLASAVSEAEYNIAYSSGYLGEHMVVTDTYTFTCNTDGIPVAATITCGDFLLKTDNTVARNAEASKIEVECVYGDLYIYSPAK